MILAKESKKKIVVTLMCTKIILISLILIINVNTNNEHLEDVL